MTDEQTSTNPFAAEPFGVEPPRQVVDPQRLPLPGTAVQDATEEAVGMYVPRVHEAGDKLPLLAAPVPDPALELRTWKVRLAGGEEITFHAHEFLMSEEGEAVFIMRTGPEAEYVAGAVSRGHWKHVISN